MAYRHGIYITESPTPILPPIEVDSSLPVAFGVAPVHKLENPSSAVNVPQICYSYSEAIQQLSFSNDWANFTLSEVIFSQFRVHGVAPLVTVNVWDPFRSAQDVLITDFVLNRNIGTITDDMAMISTVSVEYNGQKTARNEDYNLFYDQSGLVIMAMVGGLLDGVTDGVLVSYKRAVVDVTKDDIIGGFDVNTAQRTGIELADEVYLRWSKNPAFLLAPGFSDDPEVATVLIAKAKNLNSGNFRCMAALDLPADNTLSLYSNTPEWKRLNSYIDSHAFAGWPCVAIGERVFHASTRLVGLHGETDGRNNGRPHVPASNKLLSMTKMCLSDGTELPLLDQGQANLLNANGIVTFINRDGWRAWGGETTLFPTESDVKDTEIHIRRTFCWIQNEVNRTIWQKIDSPVTRVLIDRILLTINQRFNVLVAEGVLLGGRIEFLRADNEKSALLSGRLFFRVFIAPPTRAKEIVFDFQYDPDYLTTLFN